MIGANALKRLAPFFIIDESSTYLMNVRYPVNTFIQPLRNWVPFIIPTTMKFLAVALIPLVLMGCAENPLQEVTGDTKSLDSLLLTNQARGEAEDEFFPADSIAATLQSQTEDLEREVKAGIYLTLHANYSGYEADSDATWYFDSLLNIIFCEISWNTEGTSGSYTYYFEGDDILAGNELNSYNDYEELIWMNKYFKPAYGFSRTDGADADDQISYLTKNDYESKNTSIKNDYQKLLNRLREYQDSASENGNDVSILIENVVSYGEDFTEKEEFTVNKIVFDELIRD